MIKLTRKITLPEVVFNDLKGISEEIETLTKKSVSPAMTISLLIAVYKAHMSNACARDAFRQKIANLDMMSPEDFEETWDLTDSSCK